ncbi:MAG: insulinase family protein [Reyranella sp.]|uniref:M16 family metallopeptidase n=1 Tax=Reyranella sp. TaxID=1929291 RepID=UPI001203096F|nr:pitrilysin family protein [Reyranella sp.]TAJ85151.1 MAG: insulinase family protein [Reyranella sp.]TBR29650.1 MAG: insulinase family protein [Reyranella sp.]
MPLPGRRALLGGLLAGAALSPSGPALANLFAVGKRNVETFTLANGLQAIVLPSRRAPIVTQVVVYKVGSADETFGRTGAAHFLEHMMFKGTDKVPAGEFSRIVSRNGGRDNAYTTFDSTGYHQTIAAEQLDLVMRMEADRMTGVHITEREIVPERQVILEERRMRTDNVPASLLDEAVREQLYGRHKPYAMPVIGYVDDIKRLGVNDLAGFYRRHYAPNNAVLIVAGDTTTEQVRKLAERHYGPIASRKIGPRQRPSQGGTDLPQKVIRADARVVEPRWSRLWLAPSYRVGETKYAYALQVLARLFGGTETSRLSRVLVEERKVGLSAWASYGPSSLGLTSFDIGVHPAKSTSLTAVEEAVTAEMKKLLDGGVTAGEVERAQNQLLAAAIYSQDSMASGPRIYGTALSTGSTVADVDAWPQRISAVTPAEVLAAARHVWRDDGAVTALLTPAEGSR